MPVNLKVTNKLIGRTTDKRTMETHLCLVKAPTVKTESTYRFNSFKKLAVHSSRTILHIFQSITITHVNRFKKKMASSSTSHTL